MRGKQRVSASTRAWCTLPAPDLFISLFSVYNVFYNLIVDKIYNQIVEKKSPLLDNWKNIFKTSENCYFMKGLARRKARRENFDTDNDGLLIF